MRRALRYILLTVVAVVLIVLGALATPFGRGIVVGIVERAAAGSGVAVSIEGSSGWLPFTFGARRVVLSDSAGQFAEADDVSIDIKTTALLAGRLALDSLAAARLSVARQPNLPGGGSGGAALPFAADSVSIARLDLGESIAGRAASLSLTGAITTMANGGIDAQIDVQRIDGRTGLLTAKFSRASGTSPFAADVKLSEDADGILVGLIGRGSGPGYTLTAQASANGDAQQGTISLSSNGAAHFAGQFTLTPLGGDSIRLVAKGDGDLAELVPADYADLLSGPVTLAIDADWMPGKGALPALVIREGRVSSTNVHAEASGTFNDATADLSLKLDAAKAGGTISIPFVQPLTQVGSVNLTGKVAPASDRIRLDLTGRMSGLTTDGTAIPGLGLSLAVETAKDKPLAGGALPFGLRVEADAIATPTGRVESASAAPIVVTADGTYDTSSSSADTKAQIAIAGGNVTFDGTISANGAKGSATIDFADLSAIAPLSGRSISGGIAANASGMFGLANSAFKLEGDATNLDPGNPTLAKLLTGKTHIVATAGTNATGFSIEDLTVNGTTANIAGQIAVANDTIDGKLKGGIADLSLLAQASSGAATFDATISGATARPQVDATISIPNGKLLDQTVENGVVHLTGAPVDSGWLASLTLAGLYAGKPLSGKAGATLDRNGLYAFPNVDLTIGENRITGAIQRTAEGPLSGSLAVDAPNLQTLAALALATASGSGKARVDFAPDGARQSLAISFNANDVTYQTTKARQLSGDIHVDDAFGTPLMRGNAAAKGVAVGNILLDTADVTASVDGGSTHFTAKANGRDLDLSGSGTLSGGPNGQVVQLDGLSGRAFGLPVALSSPVSINLGSGASGLSGAVLSLGGGSVRIDGAVSPALNLTAALTSVSANVVNGLVPNLDAEGTVTGQVRVTGTPANPAIAWQANWQGLRVAATRNVGLPGLSLSANGTATTKYSTINAQLSGAGLSLNISGTVPFSGPGLSVKATGTAPLALLALESNRELRLDGTAQVNLALSGSVTSVATSGTVDLAGATFADTNSGFGITGATGRIAFDGQRATVQTLTGKLAQGGDVSVNGSVSINQPGLPAALTVKVANGRYADGRTINTTFNADLAINGPILGSGVVSGTVNLGHTEIELPDRLAGSATAIDVKHVNAPRGFVPPKARETATKAGAAGASGGGLRLDVQLTANSGLFVRGFGIDSELGGALRLAGTTGNPQTVGSFKMTRGRIEALGRRFDFQSGELTFSGGLVPYLNFSATTTTTDGTVTLNVTGPANDPDITFTSSPQMPEEEILARLLFNRSVGSLSPLQAAQLVDAVAQLTGAVGSGGIFARIREATGLDDLDIRQNATGGTTVGLGKRISDKVRVGVETGTSAGDGRVTIDLDITKDVKARAEAGQDGTGKVGLTYEHEY